MTADEILDELFQRGQITLEELLKHQVELPSITINRIREAIEKHETNRK